jgi:hypothetical protein
MSCYLFIVRLSGGRIEGLIEEREESSSEAIQEFSMIELSPRRSSSEVNTYG